MSTYDVIVIGSGAGGGTLVHRLASSGKRILLLERGDWLPREPANWSAHDVFVDNRYISADTWYDASGKPFQPQVHYFVGGATKLYGAALYRLRAEDFGELHHHDGPSPAWPISYDVLEPYYTQAEQLYNVHGARGEDPTEPPSSAPYPFPAVSHEPRIQQLSDDLAALGRHPFHAPCGVMLVEQDMPHSACVRCATCDGFPCLVHAMLLSGAHSKTDAFVTWAWDYFDRDHAATVAASSTARRIAWGDDVEDVPHIVVEPPGPGTTD
jgi:choline dehydrogenase-like flavoprotein